MICFPNAKLNIGLYVTEKRPDGFHNIETVFYPIGLSDALEFRADNSISNSNYIFSQTGIKLGDCTPENNICIKALNLIREKYIIPPVEIHLHKNIPAGAGLGGGSSDAAFFIKMLNEEFSLKLSNQELKVLAANIGSDCAFFIDNVPSLGTEKGNVLSPVSFSLKEYTLLLVKPNIHVSTSEAYKGVNICKPSRPLSELIIQPVEDWHKSILNVFENSVFDKYPAIGHLKDKMYSMGALYASMSGSGSSVYGIFKEGIIDTSWVSKDYFYWKEKLKI